MVLSQVIGNDSVKELLCHSISSNRINHAYIIEGGKGTGRMTVAKAFAGAVLGTENCETHPDFTVVTNQLYDPTKKQENVLVDTIRGMKKDVYIRPYMAERKVYVIPNADTMQAPAQNSLLKVFEEPPEYCTIILLAENANAFLPTILSRAVVLRLKGLETEQVADYLAENKGIDKTKAVQLAIMSGGAIGKALGLIEDEEKTELREEVFLHIKKIKDGNNQDMYNFVRFLKKNRADSGFIFEVLLSWSRDVMKTKIVGANAEIINIDKEKDIKELCGRITRENAVNITEITAKYQNITEQNANYPIAMLCMATEYREEIHG